MTGTYEQRKRIKNVRWILFWVALMQTVATLVVNAVTTFLSEPSAEFVQLRMYLQLGIIEIAAFMIPILLYARTGWSSAGRSAREELKMVPFSPLAGLLIVIMAVGGQFIMVVLKIPAVLLMQSIFPADTPQTVPLAANLRDVGLGLLCAAALPAFFEEFILRGFVFSVYEQHSTRAAVLFTTILFALLHGSVEEFLGILFLGAMLSLVLTRTGSLFAAMLYHFVTNAIAVLLEYILQLYSVQVMSAPAMLIYLFAGAFLLFFVGLFLFIRFMPRRKTVRSKRDGKLLVQSIFSVPVILCIALEVVLNFLTRSRI